MMDTPRLRMESVPRSLAALVVAVLLLALVPFAGTALARPGEIEITDDDGLVPSIRFAGEDRFDTAELIATDETEFAADFAGDAVILARADLFPDALAGSTLAGLEDAPIVLTPSTTDADDGDLNEDTAEALDEYETRGLATVYLLGGTDAIGDDVADAVRESYPGVDVVRIGGENRFETAALIADEAETSTAGAESITAIVARGDDFADALVAGALTSAAELPLLLTGTEAPLDPFAEDRLESLGIERVIIAGGTAAVSAEVEDEIEAIVGEGNVERVGGPERTATAVEFAQLAAVEFAEIGEAEFGFDTDHVNLAFGFNFPDALALGPHAGMDFNGPAPILLSASDELGEATADYFAEIGGCDFLALHVAGGTDAVPDSVEQEARGILTAEGEACSLALTPADATNFVNEVHEVTATVFDNGLGAVAGVDVDFTFEGTGTTGVPETATVTTSETGTATASFTSSTAGDVTITATVAGSADADLTDTATKTFVVASTTAFAFDTISSTLIRFDSATGVETGTPLPLSGSFNAGTDVVGLDFRPLTGALYALGSDGQLYTVDLTSGATTDVGTPLTPAAPFSFAEATGVAFDFNPVIDRIRIVLPDDTNLVVNPDTGAIQAEQARVDYAPGDDNDALDPAVTAAAYTNSVFGETSTATRLFVIDSDGDILATQSAAPPAPGEPSTVGQLTTVGALTTGITEANGFDILSPESGSNAAFVTSSDGLLTTVYTVDLATGGTTSEYTLPARNITGFTLSELDG